jgi:hypothetical protein
MMATEKADRPDLELGTRIILFITNIHVDQENELGFIKFFKNLPEKDSSTIRVFERSVTSLQVENPHT